MLFNKLSYYLYDIREPIRYDHNLLSKFLTTDTLNPKRKINEQNSGISYMTFKHLKGMTNINSVGVSSSKSMRLYPYLPPKLENQEFGHTEYEPLPSEDVN